MNMNMRKFVVTFISSDLAFRRVNIIFSDGEQVTPDAVQQKVEEKIKGVCERIVMFRIIAWSPIDEFSF